MVSTRISIWNPPETKPSVTLTVYDGTMNQVAEVIRKNFDTERPKAEPKPKKAKGKKKSKKTTEEL